MQLKRTWHYQKNHWNWWTIVKILGRAWKCMSAIFTRMQEGVGERSRRRKVKGIRAGERGAFQTEWLGIWECFGTPWITLWLLISTTRLFHLQQAKWSGKLFCTRKFWNTIQEWNPSTDISLYLQPVGPLLVLADGRVVLISCYELESLLPHWWREIASQKANVLKKGKPKVCLQHLCLPARFKLGFDSKTFPILDWHLSSYFGVM